MNRSLILSKNENIKNTIYINESGLCQFISSCKTKNKITIEFKKWLYEKVLPAIRKTERISVIMDVLLNSKEKDLIKIHNEIEDFLIDNENKNIKNTLNNLNNDINPRNKINIQSKKNLIAHLKKHMYNNRQLAIEAKNYTENKNNIVNKNNFRNIIKDGITIDEIDKQIKIKKSNEIKLNDSKFFAKYLLNLSLEENNTDNYNFELINDNINSFIDLNKLRIIISCLVRSAYFFENITHKIIHNKINLIEKMNTFDFDTIKII